MCYFARLVCICVWVCVCVCVCVPWCFRAEVTSLVASSGVWRSSSCGVDITGLLFFQAITFRQKVAIYFGEAAARLINSLAPFHRLGVTGAGVPTKTKPASATGRFPLSAVLQHTCRSTTQKNTHRLLYFWPFHIIPLGFLEFLCWLFFPAMENSYGRPAKVASSFTIAKPLSCFVTNLPRFFLGRVLLIASEL